MKTTHYFGGAARNAELFAEALREQGAKARVNKRGYNKTVRATWPEGTDTEAAVEAARPTFLRLVREASA